jgi:hypothetical protein
MKTGFCPIRAALAGVLLLLPGTLGCAGPGEGEGGSAERYRLPDWYKPLFTLHYPDGKTYEGECSWPARYDDYFEYLVHMTRQDAKPGGTITYPITLGGPRVHNFTPHGRGTMVYPDGTTKKGCWRDGAYVGPEEQEMKQP